MTQVPRSRLAGFPFRLIFFGQGHLSDNHLSLGPFYVPVCSSRTNTDAGFINQTSQRGVGNRWFHGPERSDTCPSHLAGADHGARHQGGGHGPPHRGHLGPAGLDRLGLGAGKVGFLVASLERTNGGTPV